MRRRHGREVTKASGLGNQNTTPQEERWLSSTTRIPETGGGDGQRVPAYEAGDGPRSSRGAVAGAFQSLWPRIRCESRDPRGGNRRYDRRYELGKVGFDCRLEARARPGGRVFTVRRGTAGEEEVRVRPPTLRQGAFPMPGRCGSRIITNDAELLLRVAGGDGSVRATARRVPCADARPARGASRPSARSARGFRRLRSPSC